MVSLVPSPLVRPRGPRPSGALAVLTFLDTVLLGTALVLLLGDTLNALVVVVLGGGALLRVGALCRRKGKRPRDQAVSDGS